MKKIAILVTCLFIIAALTSIATAQEKKPVVVNYWHHFGGGIYHDSVIRLVTEFNNTVGLEKGIDVRPTYVPTTAGMQSSEKLLAAIAGGVPPEANYFDRFVVGSWAARDSLTMLDDLAAAAGVTEDDYFNFAWQEANYEGHLYALPWDTDDRFFYYNKELFREVGLDPDKPPTTIAEVDEYAEKLTKADEAGKLERIGFIPWYGQGWLYTWGWVFGGDFYDEENHKITANDPKIVAALDWMASYAEKYDVTAIESFSKAFGGEAMNPFIIGQIAMQETGDWTLANLKRYAPDLDYGVVANPSPPGGEKDSTWAGGWSHVIPAGIKGEKLEAAWEFISWFCGEYAQREYCKDTYHIPTNKKAAEDPYFYEDPKHALAMSLLPTAHWRPVIPEGDMMWNELREAQDYARYGQKTAQQALDDVTANVQKALDKWFK